MHEIIAPCQCLPYIYISIWRITRGRAVSIAFMVKAMVLHKQYCILLVQNLSYLSRELFYHIHAMVLNIQRKSGYARA